MDIELDQDLGNTAEKGKGESIKNKEVEQKRKTWSFSNKPSYQALFVLWSQHSKIWRLKLDYIC